MCEVVDTCAEIESNNLVRQYNAHARATTPIRAILNKTKASMWGDSDAHPRAKTLILAILNKAQRTTSTVCGKGHGKRHGDAAGKSGRTLKRLGIAGRSLMWTSW